MFDSRFRNQVSCFLPAAKAAWGSRFLGLAPHPHFAAGTEVSEFTDYRIGDDVRYVDWNLCSRHDDLLSKRFAGNEERWLHLLLDCSPSMDTGSPRKLDFARQLAAALGWLGVSDFFHTGLATFSDRMVEYLPAGRHVGSIARKFRFLEQLTACENPKNLTVAVQQFVETCPRPGTVVLISDLFDSAGFIAALEGLRAANQRVFVVQVLDEFDLNPATAQAVRFHYVEEGRQHRDFLDDIDLENYRDEVRKFLNYVQRYCAYRGMGLAPMNSKLTLAETMRRLLRCSRVNRPVRA